ncbi:hypothetical protein [Shewanella gelidii]|uniref:Uncharacterized protein n=1 Tax=Shewanella gelidii TaxID=1642821 RepID=A0A917JMR4_9GAMM|nr:hypothetical protein [Shewanella gelidii]MCL1097513.1 hypothetical protein [Shewanella gelidii]GGI75843.1 hypothetical protein GCM10009332_11580 [Shewanella gelidii]
MKHLLMATLLVPGVAMAHTGHGGIGLFHHLVDMAPALTLVALVGYGVVWAKNRK